MAILTRRRLQALLDALGERHLTSEKRKDLIRRLDDDKRPEQALGAEYELIVCWLLSQCSNFELEPYWCAGSSRPDAYSESIFIGAEGELSEITALDNSRTKQESEMRAASQRLVEAANRIQRGAGHFLYFTYLEERENVEGRSVRIRQVPRALKITPYIEYALKELILGQQPNEIRLKEGRLDVVIERRSRRQHQLYNFHSSVPPEAKSLTDNPIYDALKRKREQLICASNQYKRVIWLCDAGSDMLRACGTARFGQRAITAEEIIQKFLRMYPDIHLVLVLAPQHSNSMLGTREKNWWKLSHFLNDGSDAILNLDWLSKAVAMLPTPRFAGYQARQLIQQRAFSPTAKGWYSGVRYRSVNNVGSVEISSRLIIDLLARRITPKQFSYFMGDREGENLFARMLESGLTFSDVTFRAGGEDEDDDRIILHYAKDPSASRFE